jgi:hypothetical protein
MTIAYRAPSVKYMCDKGYYHIFIGEEQELPGIGRLASGACSGLAPLNLPWSMSSEELHRL